MNKEILLEQGKKGNWTLRYQGRYLHSTVDPEKEARRILPEKLDSNLFIVFGLGLGYHLKVLLEKVGNSDIHVFVFEEEPAILRAFKERGVVQDSRIQVFSSQSFPQFMEYFTRHLPLDAIRNPVFLELKSEVFFFREAFDALRQKIDSFFHFHFQSLFTEAEFAPLWYRNLIINSKKIWNPEFSLWLEGDGVLIAAGHSLEKSLGFLKKIYRKVPFFAVDTALRPLMETGMIPDVVVASDSQIHNFQDFFHLKLPKETILAADISVYYKIPELFTRTFFFRTEGVAELFFEQINASENIRLPAFPGGGSVSASALALLHRLGARKVLLVGQDLAYPHLTHSVGSIHYYRLLFESRRDRPLWNGFSEIVRQRGFQDLALKNLSRWIDDWIEITGMETFQLEPVFSLSNTRKEIPEKINGKLHVFPKPAARNFPAGAFWDQFFSTLIRLRKASCLETFQQMRKESSFSGLLNLLFLKQDLYLRRKEGNPQLYLGGCFRILDRLIRAVNYAFRPF